MSSSLRRLRRCFGLIVSLLCLAPAAAHAVSISGPGSVEMPNEFTFTISGLPGHSLGVIDDDSGGGQGGCIVDDQGDPCHVTVSYGYLTNQNSVVRHFHVEDPDPQNGGSASTTVEFHQPNWHVTLTPAQNDDYEDETSVFMPSGATMSVSVTPKQWSPYRVEVFNANTGDYAGISCATADGTCTQEIDGGFHNGEEVLPKNYIAKMVDVGGLPMGDKPTSSATADLYMPDFGLTLSGPALVAPSTNFSLTVTNTYLGWTPYTITVFDSKGRYVGACDMTTSPCHPSTWSEGAGTSLTYTADIDYLGQKIASAGPIEISVVDPATATSVQGIDLAGLAAAYGSVGAICDELLPLPGTHNASSSVTDQWLACNNADLAGESGQVSLQHVLATLVGVTGVAAVLTVLQNHAPTHTPGGGTEPSPPGGTGPGPSGGPYPTDPVTGHVDPPVAVVPAAFDELVQHLKDASPAIRDATDTEAARKIAYQCVKATGNAGVPWDACLNESIFMPGNNVAQVTQMRREALYLGRSADPAANSPALDPYPAWTQLTHRIGPRRRWHEYQPECNTGYDTQLLNCDEFPYDSTHQGGEEGAAVHRPALKVLSRTQNGSEGGSLTQFYRPTGCDVVSDEAFLVLPLPPDLDLPTTKACKAGNP